MVLYTNNTYYIQSNYKHVLADKVVAPYLNHFTLSFNSSLNSSSSSCSYTRDGLINSSMVMPARGSREKNVSMSMYKNRHVRW